MRCKEIEAARQLLALSTVCSHRFNMIAKVSHTCRASLRFATPWKTVSGERM